MHHDLTPWFCKIKVWIVTGLVSTRGAPLVSAAALVRDKADSPSCIVQDTLVTNRCEIQEHRKQFRQTLTEMFRSILFMVSGLPRALELSRCTNTTAIAQRKTS